MISPQQLHVHVQLSNLNMTRLAVTCCPPCPFPLPPPRNLLHIQPRPQRPPRKRPPDGKANLRPPHHLIMPAIPHNLELHHPIPLVILDLLVRKRAPLDPLRPLNRPSFLLHHNPFFRQHERSQRLEQGFRLPIRDILIVSRVQQSNVEPGFLGCGTGDQGA
jgi:hypothetical protein